MESIDLQKAILYATGRNLRIAGGMGLTVDNPIVVTENHHGFAIETEHFAAKEVAVFYGWWQARFGKITLLEEAGKRIEEFEILCLDDNDQPTQKKLYFDISVGYKNAGKKLEQVKSNEEMEQIAQGTYYSTEDLLVPHFYGAYAYARTLRKHETLDATSLVNLLGIDIDNANKLIDALADCGFKVVRKDQSNYNL